MILLKHLLPRIERLESLLKRVLAAVTAATTSIGFGASTVVWRPGGVTAGNVFATWPEVVAKVATMNGAITIGVDTTLAAAVIPVGAWDLRPAGVVGPVDLVAATPGVFAPFVTIANAAVTLHGLSGLTDIQLDNRSTSNVITTSALVSLAFYLRGFASITQSVLAGAGVSFFNSNGGAIPAGLEIFLQDFTYIGTLDGGSNAVRVSNVAGSPSIYIQDEAIFDTNQLFVVGAAAVNVVVASTRVGYTGLNQYGTQANAPNIVPFGYVQRGSSAIVVGTGKTAAISAFITASSRIETSLKTPVGDAATIKYAAISADRVNGNPGNFKVSALSAAGGGAINGADTSTVDWEVYSS